MRQLRSLSRICIGTIIGALGATLIAQAQTEPEPGEVAADEPALADFYIGAFGGFHWINHNATIRPEDFNSRLADMPASATLEKGSGTGIQAGLLFELPFSRVFSLGLRAGYHSRGGTLSTTYTNTEDVVSSDQPNVQASVLSELVADISYLNLLPHIKVTPSSLPLYFIAGPSVLYPLEATYTYGETVVEPAGANFEENARRTRTLARGDLKTSTITPAATVGIGYDLALSPDVGLLFELQYSSTLGDIVTNLAGNGEWKTSTVGLTAGIRFGLFDETEERPVVVVREERKPVNTDGRMRASAVVDGELRPDLTITGRRVKATEAYAFLPYVFFARDTATIPSRYHRTDRKSMREFTLANIDRGDALQVYYHMLNIIGMRLRDNRKARITLTGCTSEAEGGDTTLGLRRAQAVADYLIDTWRVSKARISVVGRGLPTNPSISGVDPRESDRENQRVEFAAEDYSILAPVTLPDTSLLAPAGVVRFFTPTIDSNSLDSWALNVMIGDSLIENVETGYGPPPQQIDFAIAQRTDLTLPNPTPITGRLVVRDTLFQERAAFVSDTVMLRQEGKIEEQRNVVAGRYVDVYTLLLYSFDSDAILDFTKQAATLMTSHLNDKSTVSVVGHTDRIGLPYYNQQLSERRAQVASQNLGVQLNLKEVKGLGEKKLLYDNALPEGRYYCRTATVTIETPIDATVSDRPSNP
jgi:outer membrane protein OmpA-like peptidoglycan-associated protein